MSRPELSIVIPFFNEEENVERVLAEARAAQPTAEVIAVDDGSTDGTWAAIQRQPGVTGLRLAKNCGQSAAIYYGLQHAHGQFCGTMDGDGQNDPADFAKLRLALEGHPMTVAVGRREKRQDRWHRLAASRVANTIRQALLRDGISDTGCSLKLFPRSAVAVLVPFNGLHRFLPPIFRHAGYHLVEVPVNHRPRVAGVSKYSNWSRAWRGLYDLVGVGWLLNRLIQHPPMAVSPPHGVVAPRGTASSQAAFPQAGTPSPAGTVGEPATSRRSHPPRPVSLPQRPQ